MKNRNIFAKIWENIDSRQNIFYWRTKSGQEIDFVCKQGNELVPIEVKAGREENVPENLRQFIAAYNPQVAYVLNWSVVKDIKFKKCQVKFRPLWFPVA